MDYNDDQPKSPKGFEFFQFDDISLDSSSPVLDEDVYQQSPQQLTFKELMFLDTTEPVKSSIMHKKKNLAVVVEPNKPRPNSQRHRSSQALTSLKYRRRLKFQEIILSRLFRFTTLTSSPRQQPNSRRLSPETTNTIFLNHLRRKRLERDFVLYCLEINKKLADTLIN